MFKKVTVKISTDGSGVGSGYTPPLYGLFHSAYIKRIGAGTPQVVLKKVDDDEVVILTEAAAATEVTRAPRFAASDNAGAALTGIYEMHLFAGSKMKVEVTGGQASQADIVVVTFYIINRG